MSRITATRLARLQAGESVSEGGLIARKQTERGGITFSFGYRIPGGPKRFIRLGAYGTELTIDQARALCQKLAFERASGVDAETARAHTKRDLTVIEAAREFIEAHRTGHGIRKVHKASTQYGDERRIEKHLAGSRLGAMKVGQVRRRDVQDFVDDLEQAVSGPLARRVAVSIAGVFKHLVRTDVLEASPCLGVDKPKDVHRTRHLLPHEFRSLWSFICDHPAMPPVVHHALAFTLHSGFRRGEVEHLTFDEVSETKVVALRDSKTGPSRRWLSPQAYRHIEAMTPFRVAHHGRVFPTTTLGIWMKAAGLEGVSLHILRHSFASEASFVVPIDDVARLLGHRVTGGGAVTAGYLHRSDHHMLECAAKVGDRIEALCTGEIGRVVALRGITP